MQSHKDNNMEKEQPQVQAYTAPQETGSGGNNWFGKILKPKVIFTFLTVLLLFEAVFLVQSLLKSAPQRKPSAAKIQSITGGSFDIISSSKLVNLGDTFQTKAIIFTGGHKVSGGDLVLKYDPVFLTASPSAVLTGKVFKDYPLSFVDDKNGVIRVSGVSEKGADFSGRGVFANLSFKAKAKGQTQISVDFQKGESKDSNILDSESIQDILEKVQNLSITIQ